MKRLQKTFGRNLRKYRKDRGLSQEKLAELCELHWTYIGSVERGERNISLQNIKKIADALEVKISDLFKGINAGKNDKKK